MHSIEKSATVRRGKLRKVRAGDVVRLQDATLQVASAERERNLIQLELEGPNGERSTLIGVPKARIIVVSDEPGRDHSAGDRAAH